MPNLRIRAMPPGLLYAAVLGLPASVPTPVIPAPNPAAGDAALLSKVLDLLMSGGAFVAGLLGRPSVGSPRSALPAHQTKDSQLALGLTAVPTSR